MSAPVVSTTYSLTSAAVLDAVADEILFRAAIDALAGGPGIGWCQGKSHTGRARTGRLCIDGALNYVCRLDTGRRDDRAYAGAIRVLNDLCGNFIAWNDAPGRTQDGVLALVRYAASSADDLTFHTSGASL
jgi:hypothetical protein